MDRDVLYMRRALELALWGKGRVSPNPLVGCVVVYRDKIIGEGWHQAYGGPHAEVNAIASVHDLSLLPESTLYVNLEPCSHHGKTPPCADLLVKHRLRRVVIANRDPNPLVSGKGIDRLKDAGIAVELGVLEDEGKALNRRFFCFIKRKRPYIILKWAETADGFIARGNFDSKWISGIPARKLVHQWRSEEDAVMVGTNTAQYDNPRLNVRDWEGGDPVRVFIDKKLRLDKGLNLFDQSQPTLCYNTLKEKVEGTLAYVRLDENGFLPALLGDLYERKVQSVIIEGGALLLHSLIKEGLWDEMRIFKSKKIFEEGILAPQVLGEYTDKELVGDDFLLIYHNALP